MEREKCQSGNLELDVDYDGECINDDDEIEFEAIEADEEGHSEDPGCSGQIRLTYRDEIYYLQNLLSRTQAGPGRTVKKEQEEILPNLVQRINLISV